MFAVNALGLAPRFYYASKGVCLRGLPGGVLASVMSLAGGLAQQLGHRGLSEAAAAAGWRGCGSVGWRWRAISGQFWVAFFLNDPAVVYYIPWLLLFGVLSGVLTGLVFCVTMPLLHRYFPRA